MMRSEDDDEVLLPFLGIWEFLRKLVAAGH